MEKSEKLNQDDILFWLKAGMGLQQDKQFLLTVISDLRKQISTHEQWRDHANAEYNKLKAKYDDFRARMQIAFSAGDVVIPTPTAAQMESVSEAEAISGADEENDGHAAFAGTLRPDDPGMIPRFGQSVGGDPLPGHPIVRPGSIQHGQFGGDPLPISPSQGVRLFP